MRADTSRNWPIKNEFPSRDGKKSQGTILGSDLHIYMWPRTRKLLFIVKFFCVHFYCVFISVLTTGKKLMKHFKVSWVRCKWCTHLYWFYTQAKKHTFKFTFSDIKDSGCKRSILCEKVNFISPIKKRENPLFHTNRWNCSRQLRLLVMNTRIKLDSL